MWGKKSLVKSLGYICDDLTFWKEVLEVAFYMVTGMFILFRPFSIAEVTWCLSLSVCLLVVGCEQDVISSVREFRNLVLLWWVPLNNWHDSAFIKLTHWALDKWPRFFRRYVKMKTFYYSLKLIPKCLIDKKATFVKIMAWHQKGR